MPYPRTLIALLIHVQLIPLLLTAEQVREYALPKIPIKPSDPRKAGFEERNGEGAVELDALEALHPGEFARIVNEAIDRFEDDTIEERTRAFACEVRGELRAVEASVYAEHADEIAEATIAFNELKAAVQSRAEALAESKARFKSAADELIAQFKAAIAPAKAEFEAAVAEHDAAMRELTDQWIGRADPLFRAIADDLEAAAPNVEEFDWPELSVDEFDDPLYDSHRDYLDQIARYKRHQGRPVECKRRGGNGGAP